MRIDKDEASPKWFDPPPRLREDILTLKNITVPDKPAVPRCQASESMTEFYLLGDASGQGFGLGMQYHEGLRYD